MHFHHGKAALLISFQHGRYMAWSQVNEEIMPVLSFEFCKGAASANKLLATSLPTRVHACVRGTLKGTFTWYFTMVSIWHSIKALTKR
jgi:hypothetical protein